MDRCELAERRCRVIKFDLFQWLVDATQRQPHWWCRQCVIAAAVTSAMTEFFRPELRTAWGYIIIGLDATLLVLMWGASASAASAVTLSIPKVMRVVLWCFSGLSLFVLFVKPSAYQFASSVSGIMFASVWSFAASRPPAPPKRKQESSSRMSIGGAA